MIVASLSRASSVSHLSSDIEAAVDRNEEPTGDASSTIPSTRQTSSSRASFQPIGSGLPFHEEAYRLSTYRNALEGMDGTILAKCGFHYDSDTRSVTCFSCGITHPYQIPETASLYRHRADCAFGNGTDTRNVRIQNNSNRLRSSASASAVRATGQRLQNSSSRPVRSTRLEIDPRLLRQEARRNPAARTPINIEDRLNSIAISSNSTGRHLSGHVPASRSRPEAPSYSEREERISARGRGRDLRRPENGHEYGGNRRDRERPASYVTQFQTPEQRERSARFPCRSPRHPEMSNLEQRLETFRNWPPFHTECSPQEIARAGFFFIGPVDQTICFYCGGGLEQWALHDNPWEEHSKWHPVCEYLMQQKGLAYVQQVQQRNSTMPRRDISHWRNPSTAAQPPRTNVRPERTTFRPSSPPPEVQMPTPLAWEREERVDPQGPRRVTYRAPGMQVTTTYSTGQPLEIVDSTIGGVVVNTRRQVTLNEALRSEMVQNARGLGFLEDDIKDVVERRIRGTGIMYSTLNDLLDELAEHDSQRPSSEPRNQTPVVQSGPEEITFTNNGHREEESNCRTCGVRPSEVVFLPCGHLVTCTRCDRFWARCPICDQVVAQRLTVRRS